MKREVNQLYEFQIQKFDPGSDEWDDFGSSSCNIEARRECITEMRKCFTSDMFQIVKRTTTITEEVVE